MPFIGNQPALSYTSFAKQDFTTSATTSYTLDNPVTNENELALFINFVRQEPTTAYTASGTTLTLTSATSASDDMYCVFLGKAVQTVNPPSGSVGTAQIADLAVTSGKLASGVLPTNTPYFKAGIVEMSLAYNTYAKVTYGTEITDTAGGYNTSTSRFTVPSGGAGNYFIGAWYRPATGTDSSSYEILLYKNGSILNNSEDIQGGSVNHSYNIISMFGVTSLAVGDYIEVYARQAATVGSFNIGYSNEGRFFGYKLIT